MEPRIMAIPDGLRAIGTGENFVAVVRVEELQPGSMTRVTHDDLDVLLAHTEAGICATDDRCPQLCICEYSGL